MYKNSWVVVANSSEAKIFKATSNTTLEEEVMLSNPEARAKGTDLYSDKPGRSFDIQGKGRHHVGNLATDHESEKFAKEISLKLKEIFDRGDLSQLFLVASPKFLGHLNKSLDTNIQQIVKQKVSKDLTSETPEAVREHLTYTL